jgi:hypothetical protein
MRSLRLDITQLVLTSREVKKCSSSDLFSNNIYWISSPPNDVCWPLSIQRKGIRKPLQNWVARELHARYEKHYFPAASDMLLFVTQELKTRQDYCEYRQHAIDIVKERIRIQPMACVRDKEDPSPVEAWTFHSELQRNLIFMDESQVDSYNNTAWVSSTTGIRIPAHEQNTRLTQKQGLKWVNEISQGLTQEEFFERVEWDFFSGIGQKMHAIVYKGRGKIRAPYVVEGLLI